MSKKLPQKIQQAIWDSFSYPYAIFVFVIAALVGIIANGKIQYYVFASVCFLLAIVIVLGTYIKKKRV